MDAFKDRLSRNLSGTIDLGRQCQGRPLDDRERALAEALMSIYATPEHDFEAVASRLREMSVMAPRSGRTDWDRALLADELAATNAELDAAYEAQGYGA